MKVKAYECRRVVHAQRYVVERDGLYASRKRIVGRDVRGRGPLLRLACRADVKECLVVFVVCGCLLLVVGVDGIDVIFGIEVDGLYAALECPSAASVKVNLTACCSPLRSRMTLIASPSTHDVLVPSKSVRVGVSCVARSVTVWRFVPDCGLSEGISFTGSEHAVASIDADMIARIRVCLMAASCFNW